VFQTKPWRRAHFSGLTPGGSCLRLRLVVRRLRHWVRRDVIVDAVGKWRGFRSVGDQLTLWVRFARFSTESHFNFAAIAAFVYRRTVLLLRWKWKTRLITYSLIINLFIKLGLQPLHSFGNRCCLRRNCPPGVADRDQRPRRRLGSWESELKLQFFCKQLQTSVLEN